ncbi:MAG: hypothetical protein RL154_1248 [Pseudomonadota bacterium]|jgi:UDP-N-acetylglucosamine acyltransferase
MVKIHPNAVVESGAELDDGVEVGPSAYIGSKVKIGRDTFVAHGAHIEGLTTIGSGNKIFPNAVLGTIPQDLKYRGEETELIIGNDNIFREFTMINTGTITGISKTIIGNGSLFMAYVHAAHDCIIGNNCILANGATLAGHVELGDNAVVGGLTPVHQFVKIGKFAMLAGASAISQDIPPFCLAEGNRAVLRGLNLTGLRRHYARQDIDELKSAYKTLFLSSLPIKDSAQAILNSTVCIAVKELCEFIINTTRGIPYHTKQENEENETKSM